MGFGRKGERLAKTPTRSLPPRRGGLTVGDIPPGAPRKNQTAATDERTPQCRGARPGFGTSAQKRFFPWRRRPAPPAAECRTCRKNPFGYAQPAQFLWIRPSFFRLSAAKRHKIQNNYITLRRNVKPCGVLFCKKTADCGLPPQKSKIMLVNAALFCYNIFGTPLWWNWQTQGT